MKIVMMFGIFFILSSFVSAYSSYGETQIYNSVSTGNGSGNITGSGVSNYIPYWTGTSTLGTSPIYYEDSEHFLGIHTGAGASQPFEVEGTSKFRDYVILDNLTTYNSTTYLTVDGSNIIRKNTLTLSTGNISGTGTANYIPMFTSTNTLGNSYISKTGDNTQITSDLLLPNIGSSTKGSVLVYDTTSAPSGNITYRTPDSRIWGTSLTDGSGSASHIAYWTDANTISYDSSTLYYDAINNRIGVGTATPSASIETSGSIELRSLLDNDASNFFEVTCTTNQTMTDMNNQGSATCTNIDLLDIGLTTTKTFNLTSENCTMVYTKGLLTGGTC